MAAAPQRCRALVLRSVDYGERDRIVTLWTDRLGRLAAMARGWRRAAGKGRAVRDVPSLVLLEVALLPGRGELYRLRSAEPVRDFPGLGGDWRAAQRAGEVLAWLRDRLAPHVPEPELFEATVALLEAMAAPQAPLEALDVAFRLRALTLLGAAPALDACVACGRPAPAGRAATFDPTRGGLVCRRCGGAPLLLRGPVRAWMQACCEGRQGDVASPSEGDLQQARQAVERFAERHLAPR